MGVLKDTLHAAVWEHLKAQPRFQTFLTSLNAPTTGPSSIREAWSSLKENGWSEGVKKTTGLQAVLTERGDLFRVFTNERGHLLIALTPNAQALDLGAGLPVFDKKNIYLANAENDPVQGASGDAVKPAGLISVRAEPAAKKQKIGTCYSVAVDGSSKGKNGWFEDIIWTPEIAAKQALEKQKDAALARALFNAVEIHAGKPVRVSQLGSDFNVAQLKKDPQFKNHKLLDILRYHEDVFELVADSSNMEGGFTVKLQPGAEAALPDADTFDNDVREADLLLPERIEEPRTLRDRLQALRIEFILALNRRGGKAALQELAMEPKVQKVRSGLQKSQKLIDLIKIFPENFKVSSDDASVAIELDSVDVVDQSAIDHWDRARTQAQAQQSGYWPSQYKSTPRHEPRVVPRLYPA